MLGNLLKICGLIIWCTLCIAVGIALHILVIPVLVIGAPILMVLDKDGGYTEAFVNALNAATDFPFTFCAKTMQSWRS